MAAIHPVGHKRYAHISTIRVLGVEGTAGNESNASHSLPGLLRCIVRLPKDKHPKRVRGDCGLGTDPVMQGLEERGIPYLFKLRLSKNVKRYIQKVFWTEGWADAGQGWEGREGELALTSWARVRPHMQDSSI